MEQLPDEIMSDILARIPMGKPKIRMQGVSRRWQRLLHEPAAHSLETWHEDEYLPVDPTAAQDRGEGSSGVSRRLLNALSGCHLKTDYVNGKPVPPSRSLAWLPQRLERLKMETTMRIDWDTCPVLPRLRNLNLLELFAPPPTRLSPFFPNLDTVGLCTTRMEEGEDEGAVALLGDLQSLPSIREVTVQQTGVMSDFNGPPECRVNMRFNLYHFVQEDEGQVELPPVPPGLASHLQNIRIRFGYFEAARSTKIDLGLFAECNILSSVHLELTDHMSIHGDLLVCGLDRLPASCCSVMMRKNNDGLPFVAPVPGWQAFVGSSDFEIELRRV